MLCEALDLPGQDDVLVFDRGYPAAWLVGLPTARCMRISAIVDGQISLIVDAVSA